MKTTLAVLVQFVLFLVVDAVGSIFYHPFHIQTALPGTPLAPRSFVWDGLMLMALLWLLLLIVDALRKRLRRAGPWSTLALVIAALTGYALKLGFVTRNW
jgi:hypothetical protein